MLTIAFWNLQKRALGESVGRFIAKYEVDIVVLAEFPANINEFRQHASEFAARPVWLAADPLGPTAKTLLLSANPAVQVQSIFRSGSGRIVAQRISYPLHRDFILVSLHLPSKRDWSIESQAEEARKVAREIVEIEDRSNISKTLVVGDFNMNPFEPGMVATSGFHATSSEVVAQRGSRTVQNEQYRIFYNPMWSLMGDKSPGPPGTHYYSPAEHLTYHWHMYDQFLLSPEMLGSYRVSDVAILDHNGTNSLSKNGKPGGIYGSDHFPILMRIDSKDLI